MQKKRSREPKQSWSVMMDEFEKAREIAAQCWCDPETSMIEMDTRIAEAFAKRFSKIRTENAKLRGALEKCKLFAGNHDAVNGCRLILNTAKQALKETGGDDGK